LSKEDKIQESNNVYEIARTHIRKSGGLKTQRQAILDHLNIDMPQEIEKILQEMEANANDWDHEADISGVEKYRDIANFLRDRRQAFHRWGIDGLQYDINLIDNPNEIGVSFVTREIAGAPAPKQE